MIAIYLRVSTTRQDVASQQPDLERWAQAYAAGKEVRWYTDKATGKNMDRPGWKQLEADIHAGLVEKVVVWRLDRLGRTCSGLSALFDDLRARKVGLVSVKDAIDLGTPAGRMMANVLASVAQYETELRGERVAAGQAVARANGKTWGGSKAGVRKVVSDAQLMAIRELKSAGKRVSDIAKAVGLSRPTVYSYLTLANGAPSTGS